MNGSLSDGNENIVDIFVLSTSTTDSPLQARDLENLGYRPTFFSNARQLFESLRSGKPNLLICDSVTSPQDSYDLCRTTKADYDLWVVPVLIITSASNLSDLLHVLDCNADNFISFPYDPSYFSALVEGMLTTPVERPTPEQIKTQFKIQHDDQQFVVTADRRRLLEFLLSSFEIAVNRSGDIASITKEKENLLETLTNRDDRIRDQSRSIEALNGTLRQKEQSISALSSEVSEKEHQILEYSEEIRKLKSEIEAGKSHITEAEEEINRLTGDAAELARRYTQETGDLSRQLASISEHLAATSADLKAAEESLALESSKKSDTETLLSETAEKKEQAEKMAHELALEVEQVKADLLKEREKIQNLVTEIAALNDAKSRTEKDLSTTIQDLNDTVSKVTTDLSFRTKEVEDERARISTLEAQLASLTAEKQSADEKLQASASDIAALHETLNRTGATLESRERDLASLKTELDSIDAARRSAEEEMAGEIRKREASLKVLEDQHRAKSDERDELQRELSRIHADLNAVLVTKSAAENSLEEANARIRSLESDLSQACSSDADARRETETLRAALEEAREGIRKLELGLIAEKTGNENTGKQVAALTDELEQVKAELGNSTRVRHTLEESLAEEQKEKGRIAATLEKESRERESLAATLAKEEQVRCGAEAERDRLIALLASAETEGKSQESVFSGTIRELKVELESSLARQRDLEVQVASLSREKLAAEERAASLDREIDQARAALADEWEGHIDAQERLVASAGEKQHAGSSVATTELEYEKAKKRDLVVKGPDLPVSIGKHPQSLAAVKSPGPLTVSEPRIRNVEDLFEDEPEERNEADDRPHVSIIHEVAGEEETRGEPFSDTIPADDGSTDPEQEAESFDESSGDDYVPEEEESAVTSGEEPGSILSPGIAFNRAQWFDLLKWAHHSGTLTQEQRMQIVRMGRLIQKGRRLTHKQEEQVREMLVLVQEQGYRFV